MVEMEQGSCILFATCDLTIALLFDINHKSIKLFVPAEFKDICIFHRFLLTLKLFQSVTQVSEPFFIHRELLMLQLSILNVEELLVALLSFACKHFLFFLKFVDEVYCFARYIIFLCQVCALWREQPYYRRENSLLSWCRFSHFFAKLRPL